MSKIVSSVLLIFALILVLSMAAGYNLTVTGAMNESISNQSKQILLNGSNITGHFPTLKVNQSSSNTSALNKSIPIPNIPNVTLSLPNTPNVTGASPESLGLHVVKGYDDWPRYIYTIVPISLGPCTPSDCTQDLLLYYPSAHTGEFYQVSDSGDMTLVKRYTNWRDTWSQIIPVRLQSGYNGLLFYSSLEHTGEYYKYSNTGVITLKWSQGNWAPDWTKIFSLYPDILFFYNSPAHIGAFWRINDNGISLIQQHNNFASTAKIVPVVIVAPQPLVEDLFYFYPADDSGEIKTVEYYSADLTYYRKYFPVDYPNFVSYSQNSIVALDSFTIGPFVFFYEPNAGGGGSGWGDLYQLYQNGDLEFSQRFPILSGYHIVLPLRIEDTQGLFFYGAPVGSCSTCAYAYFVKVS